MNIIYLLLIIVFLGLSGCASYDAKAPVRDINIHRVGKVQYHLVQPGETLYAIAWRYEKDYRRLALLNNLSAPLAVKPGGLIQLTGKPVRKAVTKPKYQIHTKVEPTGAVQHWLWPTKQHRIARAFSSRNKGIDIVGNYNSPVFSVAKGKVVYAGNGIRGYGNLLIIKHNAIYLTAYAYNNRLLVKQGQWVKAGQKIALMGENNNLGRIALHFEIRRAGRAINPQKYF
jgi:lipoprotein NlpD